MGCTFSHGWKGRGGMSVPGGCPSRRHRRRDQRIPGGAARPTSLGLFHLLCCFQINIPRSSPRYFNPFHDPGVSIHISHLLWCFVSEEGESKRQRTPNGESDECFVSFRAEKLVDKVRATLSFISTCICHSVFWNLFPNQKLGCA
jgi:hypothetical protein